MKACMDCRYRIGVMHEPDNWHCGIAGYRVRRERFETNGDASGTFCGIEGKWWKPREEALEDREVVIQSSEEYEEEETDEPEEIKEEKGKFSRFAWWRER